MAEVTLEWLMVPERKQRIWQAAEVIGENRICQSAAIVQNTFWELLGFYSGLSNRRRPDVTLFHLSHFILAEEAVGELDSHLRLRHVPGAFSQMLALSRYLLRGYCAESSQLARASLGECRWPNELIALVVGYLPVADNREPVNLNSSFFCGVFPEFSGKRFDERAHRYETAYAQFSRLLEVASAAASTANAGAVKAANVDLAALDIPWAAMDIDDERIARPSTAFELYCSHTRSIAMAEKKSYPNHRTLARQWNRLRFLPDGVPFQLEAQKEITQCAERRHSSIKEIKKLVACSFVTRWRTPSHLSRFSFEVMERAWMHVLCRDLCR